MNRTVFFDRMRSWPFGGRLTQAQIRGIPSTIWAGWARIRGRDAQP